MDVKQSVGNLETTFQENPLVGILLVVGILLALLVFGGLLLDMFIEKRRARQKARAVERLHKYLEELPGSKS